MIPTHLKVLTIVERPFIYIRNKTFGVACAEEEDRGGWVECPEYVVTGGATRAPGGSFCCRGYCMDLLAQLSATCNFTYSLHVSLAGDYGNLERNNETGKQVEMMMMIEMMMMMMVMMMMIMMMMPRSGLG